MTDTKLQTSTKAQPEPSRDRGVGILQSRAFLFFAAATLVLQIVVLQVHCYAFTGGWLTPYHFDSWAAKLAGAALLAVFSVAAWGLWFVLGTWALQWVRLSLRASIVLVSLAWVVAMVADTFVRQQIHKTVGEQFDMTGYTFSTDGNWRIILAFTWHTFGDAIVTGAALCFAAAVAGWLTFRVTRHRRFNLGPVDRLTRRGIRLAVTACTIVALLCFSVFYDLWPTARWASTRSIVGLPFHVAVLWASDIDGDGVSPFERPADFAPFDPSRHPYALDIPGDGIDQNNLLGDLRIEDVHPDDLADTLARLDYPEVRFARRPNVVIVVLESMRYDTLAAEVDGKAVLPNFRRLIAQGALAPVRAYASNGFSLVSTSELFWGGFYNPGSSLVDDFNSNGYTTVTISGADESWGDLKRRNGLDRCDIFKDPNTEPDQAFWNILPASFVLGHVEAFLAERDPDKPFFLYTDLQETHFPYNTPTPYVFIDKPCPRPLMRKHPDWMRRTFYNQAHAVDAACSRLVEMIEASPGGRDTVFVFISDHGESLGEDGIIGHGLLLNDVQTHLLAIIRNPQCDVPDTLGHGDIRGLLRRMLTGEKSASPRVVDNPERRLLLFSRSVERPLRLGEYNSTEGRITYNFSTGLIHHQPSDTWLPLTGQDDPHGYRGRIRRLIRRWEHLRWVNRENPGWRDRSEACF